jgi:hypothetical protein
MVGLALLMALLLLAGCDQSPGPALAVVEVPVPAAGGSAEPHLAKGPDDSVVLSWVEPTPHGSALRFSVLDSTQGWGASRLVAQGSNWFVNWADFPSVVPVSDSLWAAHWLEKREGSAYAYDIAASLSRDAGLTWGERLIPHQDGTLTEHGFVSLFPWQEGVGILWLDGRNMLEEGGMTLRAAAFTADGELGHSTLVDELVCDCCQTDVATSPDGPIAVYRDRSRGEIRDIAVVRLIDNHWETPRAVAEDGWQIAGCPVNGPAIAASGAASGARVAVAWYTEAHELPRVRLAFSADGAESFSAAIDVASDRPLGRVDVVLLDSGDAIVSWLEQGADEGAELYIRRVSASGATGQRYLVARTGSGRASGFPQMLLTDDDLLFAWTESIADWPQVRAARVAVSLVR